MNCDYVRDHYKVPACIGRRVRFTSKGSGVREGVIGKDGGNYIAVNFDNAKPGQAVNVHPTDPGLEYLGMGKVRTMTRSQQNYQDYLSSGHDSFADFMGFRSKASIKRQKDDKAKGLSFSNSYYRYI